MIAAKKLRLPGGYVVTLLPGDRPDEYQILKPEHVDWEYVAHFMLVVTEGRAERYGE